MLFTRANIPRLQPQQATPVYFNEADPWHRPWQSNKGPNNVDYASAG